MTLRAGRYELLATIASGGMATVHLGRAVGAGGFERLVAIKTMHPHLSNEPEFVSMFLDEARLAARIRHPNVVGTIDIQQDEQGLLLVMEYIEGPAMSQAVRALHKRNEKLPLDITLRVMLDMLAGLHAAHELCGPTGDPLNVIHRDVSPHNILVGVDGIARIMDFGVARAEARISTTRGGESKGKVNYMAPEQARMGEMDRRVDVYAAGVVFWEFLVGRRLMRGENDIVIMNQIFNVNHPHPHELNESVPPELSEVVMRAISRERDDRFPTTAAFAEAVDKVVQTCGLKVATPRTLGAFIRELHIHKAPTDLPSSSHSLPGPVSQTRPSATPASVISADTPPPNTSSSAPGSESRGGFASAPPTAPKSASPNRTVLIGAFAGTLLLSAVLWFVFAGPSSKDKPAEPVANASTAAPTTAAPTTAAPTTAAPTTAVPASVDKPQEPAPVASTVAAASASAPSETPAPSATAAPNQRTPGANTGASKSSKTFIPKEL